MFFNKIANIFYRNTHVTIMYLSSTNDVKDILNTLTPLVTEKIPFYIKGTKIVVKATINEIISCYNDNPQYSLNNVTLVETYGYIRKYAFTPYNILHNITTT